VPFLLIETKTFSNYLQITGNPRVNPIRKEFQYGDQKVILETGEIARQADGAVMIDVGGTSILVTVVGKKNAAGGDFSH